MKQDDTRKKLIETIDATPTWVECVPALVVMVSEGSGETRVAGMAELMKMARCADAYRAMQAKLKVEIEARADQVLGRQSPVRRPSK